MRPRIRKFALTIHVTLSVGWIGGVLAYLVLVIAAMTGQSDLILRSAWIAMELIGLYLIVPLALTSVVSGLVMAIGTPWGLLKHYCWIRSQGSSGVRWRIHIIQGKALSHPYQDFNGLLTSNAVDAAIAALELKRDVVHGSSYMRSDAQRLDKRFAKGRRR